MRKAQAWSMDALIAVGVIIVALLVLIGFVAPVAFNKNQEVLKKDSELLSQSVTIPSTALGLSNGKISEHDIMELSKRITTDDAVLNKKNYLAIKSALGLSTDFCIHFADINNKIVPIGTRESGFVWFIGTPDVTVTVDYDFTDQQGINHPSQKLTFTCSGLLTNCETLGSRDYAKSLGFICQ